ncbi:alpha/beta hydrolase [Kribbella sp. NPDC048915]|uniref:alpha/beta fold hydrolase n=1 Tax=Kribbella sp. NPDC048915 TaxID=3155148 RepID=UPI003406BB71
MFEERGRTAHLAWYRTAEGTADVAFLHGFSDSAHCWAPLLSALPDMKALAIDARGHGESGLPDEPYGYAGHRDDVARVLEAQPGEAKIVVGHSMGAMSAAYLAATRPELVRALVLEDPPTEEQPRRNGTCGMPEWLADARALDLEARMASADPHWPEDEREPWAVSKAQVNPKMFDLDYQGVGPLHEVLAKTSCPILLIHGDTDRGSLISDDYAARCTEAAGGELRAVHLREAGHSVRRDQRQRYAEELAAFRTEHQPG